jgi:hypothetical protein
LIGLEDIEGVGTGVADFLAGLSARGAAVGFGTDFRVAAGDGAGVAAARAAVFFLSSSGSTVARRGGSAL